MQSASSSLDRLFFIFITLLLSKTYTLLSVYGLFSLLKAIQEHGPDIWCLKYDPLMILLLNAFDLQTVFRAFIFSLFYPSLLIGLCLLQPGCARGLADLWNAHSVFSFVSLGLRAGFLFSWLFFAFLNICFICILFSCFLRLLIEM